MQPSSGKQFTHDAQYWVEIRHQDHCAFCKDAVRTDCASAPKDAGKRRVRVAQFIYFQEAIDYAQALQKAGVQSWIRKPRYAGKRIESEYSHYPVSLLDSGRSKAMAEGSYVIREKSTKRGVCEIFPGKLLAFAQANLNRERYELVPIGQYLAEFNAEVRRCQGK